jgi:hypothetical protein
MNRAAIRLPHLAFATLADTFRLERILARDIKHVGVCDEECGDVAGQSLFSDR